ncbi:MAG: phosphate ABC transporter substrate-binding protein [Bacteroidales bacterium]|nr:MAG: phosphate ABC transporter substrate-binding protein [Bacteroidales bacterium]
MKRVIISVIALAFAINGQAQRIKGSDTMLPLSQKEAESYMKTNSTFKVTVTGGGSGVGIAALIDNTTDLAQSSRKIKMDEKIKLQESGVTYKEVIAAYDALAVVVNPNNGVSQLTREQLEGIFIGKIKNWKEVGGDDAKIIVYSRETSSGTYEFFKEHVMNKKNFANDVLSMPATGAIIQSVSQTKGAIGYVGLAYLDKSVKAIKVSYDKGKNYVEPSMVNAKNKTYPVVRPLYYYYSTKVENKVKPYLDFVLSAEGQKIVESVGYVPLK